MMRHLRRWLLHGLRHGSYLAIAASALLAAAFLAAYILLPRLVEQKADIERFLSHETGYQIRIGKLDTFWEGLNPGVRALGVALYAEDATRPALTLDDVRVSLSTLPLLIGRFRIADLTITAPRLAVERARDGRFTVTGLKAAAEGAADVGPVLLAWLGQEGQVAILKGELQYFDHAEPDKAIYVRDIDIRLTNRGERHHLSLQAGLPREICQDCALIADVRGELTAPLALESEIYLRAVSLDLGALPRIARERLPAGLKGRVTTEFWSDWAAGRLIGAKGSFAVTDIDVPVPDYPSVRLRKATARFNLLREANRFQLVMHRALLQPGERVWQMGTLRFDQRGEARTVQIGRIDLAAITEFVQLHELDQPAARRWLALEPVGTVGDVRVLLDGPLAQLRDFSFRGELANVGTQAHGRLPAIHGLSGTLAFGRNAGSFDIDSRDLVLSLPRLFRGAFPPARVRTELRWQRASDHWTVATDSFSLRSTDMRVKGKLRLRLPDDGTAPVMDLQASFRDVNGGNVRTYVPAAVLEPDTLRWIDSSFLGGRITTAELVLQGPLAAFPFEHGGGRFEIRGHVVDGIYEYLTGWMPVMQAEVDVMVRGRDVAVTGRGRIGSLDAEHVTVQTAVRPSAANASRRFVEVTAEASGSVAETVRILHAVKADDRSNRWKRDLPADLEGGGNGWLGIRVSVPAGSPKQTTFDATYRFEDAVLGLADLGLRASALRGSVQFNRDGARSGHVHGTALEGPLEVRFTPQASGVTAEIAATSKGSGIARWLGTRFAGRVDGELAWQARWTVHDGLASLRAEAPALKTLSLRLPAPLTYAKGLPDTRATLRVVRHRSGDAELIAEAGQLAGARVLLAGAGAGGRPVVKRGEISIGETTARLPDRTGLQLNVRGEQLDLDGWIDLFAGAVTAPPPTGLVAVRGQFDKTRFLDRDFGQFAAGLYRRGTTWSGRIAGERLAGELRYDRKDQAARVTLDLLHLNLAKAPKRAKKKADAGTDPRRLPIVLIKAKRFVYGDGDYGALDLYGHPTAEGWQVAHLKLTRPEAHANLTGEWRVVGNQQRSRISLAMESSDVATSSKAVNLRGLFGSGKLEGTIDLQWSGSFADFDMARASGKIKSKARDGSLSEVKEGAVRIFGVLDISSLLRYLTLDFKPLVEEGFLYKTMKFEATVENGNLYTDDFLIKGRSADVKASGRVGIATEDLDLVLEVSPHVGAGAALASWWLFGPQAGAIALAIQQIFKGAGAGVRVIYEVKGSWDKPDIKRVVTDDKQKIKQPIEDSAVSGAGD